MCEGSQNRKPLRVVLVDDHRLVRQGLKLLLERDGDVQVVGEAQDMPTALALLEHTSCDLILMDVCLPGQDGIATTRTVKERYAGVEVLMLSMHADERFVVDSLRSGASGYVIKSASRDELMCAIREVCSGEIHIHPRAVPDLLETFRTLLVRPGEGWGRSLTEREHVTLSLLAQGCTNREIAERLHLSPVTVRCYLRTLYRKLGVTGRDEAVRAAWRQGLVAPLDGVGRPTPVGAVSA